MIRTLVIVAAVSLFPLSASANQIEDSIVSQLRSQGFTKIETSRTFLGRARVTAKSPTLDREIIFNPVTGAILRDYWTERSNGRIGVTLVDPNVPASHGQDQNDDDASSDDGNDSGDSGGEDSGDNGDSGGDSSGGDDGSGDSGDSGGENSGDSGDSGGDNGGDGNSGGEDGGDSGGEDGGDD